MPVFRSTLFILALLVATGNAWATKPAPAASHCPAPETRQFDFWIGEWEVRDMGALAGHNSVRAILDGCVIQENWRGVSESAGTSLNFYDTAHKHWRQLWVWREGTTLELEGDFHDGQMVLQGPSVSPKGEQLLNRISWSKNADGTVRQHWEISRDEGATWHTEFDGEYRRIKKR